MSFTTIRYLYCDGKKCPRLGEAALCAPNHNEPIAEQRAAVARSHGWIHHNGKDYCDQCRDKHEGSGH